MALTENSYYYNGQLRSYIRQFLAIFTGMQVKFGKFNDHDEELVDVNVVYGLPDRVVAALLTGNASNVPIRLPIISGRFVAAPYAAHRAHGISTERRQSYIEVGQMLPDGVKVAHQIMPVPYDLEMELNIFASNTDQLCQILEQIMIIFDPQLVIQRSDAPFDWSRMTSVQLTDGPRLDQYGPLGPDRRLPQCTLRFTMPIWISAPIDVRNDIIHKVKMRVGMVNGSVTANEVVEIFDMEDIPYETVSDAANIPFQ